MYLPKRQKIPAKSIHVIGGYCKIIVGEAHTCSDTHTMFRPDSDKLRHSHGFAWFPTKLSAIQTCNLSVLLLPLFADNLITTKNITNYILPGQFFRFFTQFPVSGQIMKITLLSDKCCRVGCYNNLTFLGSSDIF